MGYADERLELIARLRRGAPGRSLADTVRLDALALRFHLGTSLADLRVPVHLDESVRAAVNGAVRDLFFLLSLRHRAALRPNEYDRLILLDGFDPRAARQTAFNAPSSVKSESVRQAFLEAPELHPALDGGLIASWLSAGRPGRALPGTLSVLLRRAQAETEGRRDPPEPTAYLVLLASRALAHAAMGTLKDLPISGPVGRGLHGAVAAGLLVASRLALREAGVADRPWGPACEVTAAPLPWLGGIRMFWGSGLACYGVPFIEAPVRFNEHVQKIAQGGTPEATAADVAADLSGSKEAMRKAARQVALARLRADLLAVLRLAEVSRAPSFSVETQSLAQLYQVPGALERVLAAPALRKELQEKSRAAAKAAGEPARTPIESLMWTAKEWKDDDPGAWLPQDEVVETWAAAVSALAVDTALETALGGAEAQLVHRLGGESEGGIETEHEAGKLYLLGLEERPLLKTRQRAAHMGHLFCDMKDFTKRTAFLKETVVADFLSREFYGPILTAAARHAQGAAHLADKGGIYLNNLLGDAVSFSGDIVALLELAQDIRAALGSYGRRLDKEGSREAVAKAISSIEQKFNVRRMQLAAAAQSAHEAQRRGALDPVSGEEPASRLRALQAELSRLEEERTGEIALASGEKLEAGIFVSFGAPPEVATFEDHIFGQIKVSIAEKINESARGTARNGGVRARVEALLAAERARLGRPGLVCPLHVSVAQPLSMPVPEDVAVAVRRSVAARDLKGAETALGALVRQFVARLASEQVDDDRGDIYNGGAAISDDALKAYMQARGDEMVFLRRDVQMAQLAPPLREKFVFPHPALRLVLAVSPDGQALQQLFVYIGRALFRGFEKQGGLGVYEMIARDNPLFSLLAQHHLGAWLAEHEATSQQGSAPARRSNG